MKLTLVGFLTLLFLSLSATPIQGQGLDPAKCTHCRDIYAGAAADVLFRGPWIRDGWRNTAPKRVLMVGATGALYELGSMAFGKLAHDPDSFSVTDVAYNMGGAVAMEFAWFLAEKVFGLCGGKTR